MAWVKVKWIPPMFAAFNTIAPNRSKASDGTIGDLAHRRSPSGHNPDESGAPEYTDADNIDEVRAADVTTALRSDITMEQVVQRILATPAERNRLAYIIFNRRIWRKRNGWKQESYTGSDPHDTHAHFSGDPNYDEDAGEWRSILSFSEEQMGDFNQSDVNAWTAARRLEALTKNLPATIGDGTHTSEPNELHAELARIAAKQDQLLTASAASAVREVATKAAIDAMAAAIATAGGDVDVAAITAHIDSKVAEVTETVEDLQAQLAAANERETELRGRLADAYAAADGPPV